MLATGKTRKITINPVTRIEGHGKVTIHLDENGHVTQARFHIVEFRGFERFALGRPYWEVPVMIQRLCGICPVSHHLCAAKAMDWIVGGERLSPCAEKMRRLMHYGQMFQSHALHFFHLSSPDLLFGFSSDVARRNIIGVIQAHPEIARRAVLMRKYGQEVIKATSGKKIHGTGAIPGGINKNLSTTERDALRRDIGQMIEWSQAAVKLVKDIRAKDPTFFDSFGAFESNCVSLVRADGALDFYDGGLRAKDAEGNIIFDHVRPMDYLDYIREEVRAWSYMKFPFIRSLGKEKGWYRVGPLARVNNCDFIPTPLAEEERKEFRAATGGKPSNSSLHYHWARMIELLHAAELMRDLLNDPDLQSSDLVRRGLRREETVAILEAPRGTLFHHYCVNANDEVTLINLIVSTTNNNEAMNRVVQKIARDYLEGQVITEGLLNHIEVGIRAYDPCLSCATHAVGQMPLVVTLMGSQGQTLDMKARGAGCPQS